MVLELEAMASLEEKFIVIGLVLLLMLAFGLVFACLLTEKIMS